MKTVKEKAEAYDKVREKIAVRFGTNVAEEIFSEFEDSEDEQIKKALIKYFSEGREYLSIIPYNKEECIAWLEKVQKPAEWNEETVKRALLSEVLPCFMHGGEADEVVAKLDEVMSNLNS